MSGATVREFVGLLPTYLCTTGIRDSIAGMSSAGRQPPPGGSQEDAGDVLSVSLPAPACLGSVSAEALEGSEDQGCLFAAESDDCLCGWCARRYQVSCFGLDLALRPDVTYAVMCERILVAVDDACVSYECERGINLVVAGLKWPSEGKDFFCRVFVSATASCVQTRLEHALRREMRLLQSETAPEAVVDTTGYGPPGEQSAFGAFFLWCRSWWKGIEVDDVDTRKGVVPVGDRNRHAENLGPLV